MDRRFLILISTLFVQSLYGASIEVPSTTLNGDVTSSTSLNGTPLENLSNLTLEDAKVLAELQRLRQSGERFRGEAMQFIQSLPNRLSAGFAQSHQLFQLLAQMFSSAVNDQIQNIQATGRYLGENAKGLALEGLKRGQSGINAGVQLGGNVLERVRTNGNALLKNGMSYLQSGAGSGSAAITTRDLTSQVTAPVSNQATRLTSSMKDASKTVTSQLPESDKLPENMTDDELLKAQDYDPEDPEDDFDFDEGLDEDQLTAPKLATRDDKPVTTVLSDEINGVGAAGTDMFKNVARFTSGGIRGLLDALSTVLVTTSEVGTHARSALSTVNKAGGGLISSVIDTSGNIVSTALDKSGSVVGSMRVGGGAQVPTPKA